MSTGMKIAASVFLGVLFGYALGRFVGQWFAYNIYITGFVGATVGGTVGWVSCEPRALWRAFVREIRALPEQSRVAVDTVREAAPAVLKDTIVIAVFLAINFCAWLALEHGLNADVTLGSVLQKPVSAFGFPIVIGLVSLLMFNWPAMLDERYPSGMKWIDNMPWQRQLVLLANPISLLLGIAVVAAFLALGILAMVLMAAIEMIEQVGHVFLAIPKAARGIGRAATRAIVFVHSDERMTCLIGAGLGGGIAAMFDRFFTGLCIGLAAALADYYLLKPIVVAKLNNG